MNLCRASHLAAALGEKMGSLNLKIPPPQSLCPHARQVLAMWGQRWPALVPSPGPQPREGPRAGGRWPADCLAMRLLPRFLGCGRASPLTWQQRGGRALGARVLGDGSSWGQESHQLTHRPGLLPSITTGLLGPHQSPGPPQQDGRAAQLGVSV